MKTTASAVSPQPNSQSKAICRVRHAESTADLRAVRALRFAVFKLKINEPFDQSFPTLLTADRFDDICELAKHIRPLNKSACR
jgi:hypothetical protein